MREPLERWNETFARYKAGFERLLDEFGVADIRTVPAARVSDIFRTGVSDIPPPPRGTRLTPEQKKLRKEKLGDLLRYIAGPPISSDDLQVLAEVESLAPSRLTVARGEAAGGGDDAAGPAQRVLSTVLEAVDPKRFPWIAAGRVPTGAEKEAAVLASAALITAQRVATDRRSEGKEAQEGQVRAFLAGMGFAAMGARGIRTLEDAPARGEFCPESAVGTRRADVVVRLFDGRLLPIECKVSNSALNSFKRINNDAAVKARTWKEEFGRNQVVPAAVLSGVFRVENLVQAQSEGLTLFWAHDLAPLQGFIDGTRAAR